MREMTPERVHGSYVRIACSKCIRLLGGLPRFLNVLFMWVSAPNRFSIFYE